LLKVPNSGGWITSQAEKTHHNRSTHHPQLYWYFQDKLLWTCALTEMFQKPHLLHKSLVPKQLCALLITKHNHNKW
jgi:hypothetical protein